MLCMVIVNLSQALQQMQRKYAGELLWADALCINQSDDKEKTHQVRMMQQIYRQSQQVLIWLGPEQPNDALGFSFARQLHNSIKDLICPADWPELAIRERLQDLRYPGDMLTNPNHPSWTAMINIISREWVERPG